MKISKMPAPPPPPPMAPAAPPPPIFKAPKGGPDDRGALLKSIRNGAKLKKAVTNDRSAPLVAGTSSNNRAVNNVDNSSNSSVSSAKNFSSIHMELKRQLGGDNDSSANNVVSPMRNFNSIQMELKKQLANDNRNRGPPPPAPNRNLPDVNFQKKNLTPKANGPNGIHLSQLSLNTNSSLQVNTSTLHRKAKSNANLSSLESNDDTNGFQHTRPVINHGKPNLAPKPPVLNGKPFLTPKSSSNSNNKSSLGRAHSMKNSPRSPSPQGSVETVNQSIKFGTVRHMSSVLSQALSTNPGQPVRTRPALNGRPTAPPPSVPQQPPPPVPTYPSSPSQPAPPPPSKTGAVKHPNHAPPPPPPTAPPVAPPPPPPHKTLHMPARQQAPSIPPPMSNNAANPPPPPPRHSSMRENPMTNVTVDLEEKFKHLFKTVDKFPHPPPYRNLTKLYERPTKKPNYVV